MTQLGLEYQKALSLAAKRVALSTSANEARTLSRMLDDLLEPQRNLLLHDWGEGEAGYDEAVKALNDANEAAEEAITDLDAVAQYVTRFGKAITILAKFAGSLGL